MRDIQPEIDAFIRQGMEEVRARMEEVGKEAEAINVMAGDYKNRTWNLRRSNYHKVEDDGLIIGNSADYASDVEARGYMVCSEGALYAERKLNGN